LERLTQKKKYEPEGEGGISRVQRVVENDVNGGRIDSRGAFVKKGGVARLNGEFRPLLMTNIGTGDGLEKGKTKKEK